MKIGFFGDGPWAVRALEIFATRKDYQVVFVVTRSPSPDVALVDLAKRLAIPIMSPVKINDPDTIEALRAFGAELHVSMSYDQILRAPILAVPPRGTLNCHAGALPFYRGRNPLTWAIINGETEFGVTVHWVDTDIDTGDIVVQVMSPIGPQDDYASLLVRAHGLCADALVGAVDQVHSGRDRRIKQSDIDPVGLYCCRRRPGDEEIRWEWPSIQVTNFVRALVPPGPGARTSYNGREFAVLKAQPVDGARSYAGTPGEVVGRTEDAILVKTGDSLIHVYKWASVAADGSIGVPTMPDVPRGARFGRNSAEHLARLEARVGMLEAAIAKAGLRE